MVVCTHGVRVARVRFPAVRHEARNPCRRLALKKGFLYNISMKEGRQEKLWIPPFMMAAGVFLGWLLFGYNWYPEEEEQDLNEYKQRVTEIQSLLSDLRGSRDIPFEEALIRDALGFEDPRSSATVTHQSGQFFKVKVRVPTGSPSGWGGGYAILKKEGDKYRVLYEGQESPHCDVVEEENIPNEIMESFSPPECWDDEVGWRQPK